MFAMVLDRPGRKLRATEVELPPLGPDELLIRVHACGVCRTDLHVVDGELDHPTLPLVPGHEIVGRVEQCGASVQGFAVGDRVGVPWLANTCGTCPFCRTGRENLCDHPQFTGYTVNGGFAEQTIAHQHYCFKLPAQFSDVDAAPLLCAGLIGYRSLVMAGDARRLGIYGFGAAAHLIAQVALHQGRTLYAFTRRGDDDSQRFARELGAAWAGDSAAQPPELLDAAIIYAPLGNLVPAALAATEKGGTVVCAGIHMSDIPSFPYRLLWGERVVRSVANLTRADGVEFLKLAAEVPVKVRTQTYPLREANQALDDLRSGRVTGAAVLVTDAAQ
jgi:propanol-preferring alcohol dehydrogenase